MARIQVGGAGGAPANNFIRSLKASDRRDYLIGTSSVPSDLFLADVQERYVVPGAASPHYSAALLRLLSTTQPHFLHVQHDFEVRAVSRLRREIQALGVTLFLPASDVVETCVDKFSSYQAWKKAGVPVPETVLLASHDDVKPAFDRLGPQLWIRATTGGGGRGALPTDDPLFAKLWIDRFAGWGQFTAAERLGSDTVTWLSIWHEGELIVGQGRLRRSWNFGDRTMSGVTGITGVGETCSDEVVDKLAQAAIWAIDKRPHGIYGVDMTYDRSGRPRVTELNIGRFFTTHYFFAKAGLNMPAIYCDIALDKKFPNLNRKINPLPPGLVWIRGMDVEPALTTAEELDTLEKQITWNH
jgi:carbamoyl-phosphate synthase large subunit